MMKKVIVAYDDSVMPNVAIKSITGGKSFGSTIFKRIKLIDHTSKMMESVDSVSLFVSIDEISSFVVNQIDYDYSVMVLKSCFIISNLNEFEVLAEKASCANEEYRVNVDDKIACVIYHSAEAFKDIFIDRKNTNKTENQYSEIKCNAFTDISDVKNFRQFITSGFEARFFNAVTGDDYKVVKSSKNIEKLEKEYKFYGLLPDSMKQWFVMPYDYQVDGDTASYSMERFNMADLAIRYVHGAISSEEFEVILDKIFYYIGQRIQKTVTKEEYELSANSLYVQKVEERIASLKVLPEFEIIKNLISDNTDYESIDEIVAEYKKLYEDIRKDKNFKNILVVAHGDLCFSNILYSHEASLIRFIDPKGALTEEDLYMDPYYDIAKLSHSVCGYYDFFNSGLYEITLDENLKSHLTMGCDNSSYVKIFRDKLNECSIDFKLVRLYECSLFLSMLPLHIDRPKKVYAFILNAIAIIESLKNEMK